MTLFAWDAQYSVNINAIDRQHQRLFALFNELYEAMQEGHADDVIDKVLDRALDYTAYHFATEERLLREYGYAEEAAHRQEHAKLEEHLKVLLQKRRVGESRVALATLKLLCDWLNEHILKSDKKFAAFLTQQGVH